MGLPCLELYDTVKPFERVIIQGEDDWMSSQLFSTLMGLGVGGSGVIFSLLNIRTVA